MRLFKYLHLQFRLDIRQEEQVAIAVLIGNDGMKIGVDAQMCVERIARVHIHMVARTPAERWPFAYLQTRQIDGALTPEIQVFAREVAPDDSYQVHLAIQ